MSLTDAGNTPRRSKAETLQDLRWRWASSAHQSQRFASLAAEISASRKRASGCFRPLSGGHLGRLGRDVMISGAHSCPAKIRWHQSADGPSKMLRANISRGMRSGLNPVKRRAIRRLEQNLFLTLARSPSRPSKRRISSQPSAR